MLLTRAEAARRLGVAPKTLANWYSKGRGPRVVHVGRLAQYVEAEVAEFIESLKAQRAA